MGDTPVSEIVPVNAEPVLLVTVMNPVSGVAQIEPLVLHTAAEAPEAVPVAFFPLSLNPFGLLAMKDVFGATDWMIKFPLLKVSVVKPPIAMFSPAKMSSPLSRV